MKVAQLRFVFTVLSCALLACSYASFAYAEGEGGEGEEEGAAEAAPAPENAEIWIGGAKVSNSEIDTAEPESEGEAE